MPLVIFCLLFSFVDYVPVKGEIFFKAVYTLSFESIANSLYCLCVWWTVAWKSPWITWGVLLHDAYAQLTVLLSYTDVGDRGRVWAAGLTHAILKVVDFK